MKNKWNRICRGSRAAHPRFYKELRTLDEQRKRGEIPDAQRQLAMTRQTTAKRHRRPAPGEDIPGTEEIGRPLSPNCAAASTRTRGTECLTPSLGKVGDKDLADDSGKRGPPGTVSPLRED